VGNFGLCTISHSSVGFLILSSWAEKNDKINSDAELQFREDGG
jgi:hypothetical protein